MTTIKLINGSSYVVEQSLSELQVLFTKYDIVELFDSINKKSIVIDRHDVLDLTDYETLVGR